MAVSNGMIHRQKNGLRRLFIAAIIGVVSLYALFEARGLLRGPSIVIEYPLSGATITDDLVRITGRTERISSISMNDRPVFISEQGKIDETAALLEGVNRMTFKGADRFGKTTTVELVLLYRPGERPTLAPPADATSTATTS